MAINKLMIIEDDELEMKIISSQLENSLKVNELVTFNSGISALAYLEATPSPWPDVIICDIAMPVMDGWSFLDNYQRMFGNNGNKPLICVLSSTCLQVDLDQARNRKWVSMYIPKPLNKEKVEQIRKHYEIGRNMHRKIIRGMKF